jgi:hypothetical protein
MHPVYKVGILHERVDEKSSAACGDAVALPIQGSCHHPAALRAGPDLRPRRSRIGNHTQDEHDEKQAAQGALLSATGLGSRTTHERWDGLWIVTQVPFIPKTLWNLWRGRRGSNPRPLPLQNDAVNGIKGLSGTPGYRKIPFRHVWYNQLCPCLCTCLISSYLDGTVSSRAHRFLQNR